LEMAQLAVAKIKQDMASVSGEKRSKEKETASSTSKHSSLLHSVEALVAEIEKVDEEHVLVEVARLEAVEECREAEAQRRATADRYSALIEETRKKQSRILQQLGRDDTEEETEAKLAITVRNAENLKIELARVKEMAAKEVAVEERSNSAYLIEKMTEELSKIKEQRSEFMASMEILGNELHQAHESATTLEKKHQTAASTIHILKSKIKKAKSKLEAATAELDKAESMSSSLSQTLEQVKTEGESIINELNSINKEISDVKEETRRADTENEFMEVELQSAIRELTAAKSSEAEAMEKLKRLAYFEVRSRALASLRSSKMTISKFEYEYLKGRAAKANKVADKKVSAAKAWTKAIKAREQEIVLKLEAQKQSVTTVPERRSSFR
ncbi:hypothetical protein M569_02218, partial [Genlisea aurea]